MSKYITQVSNNNAKLTYEYLMYTSECGATTMTYEELRNHRIIYIQIIFISIYPEYQCNII